MTLTGALLPHLTPDMARGLSSDAAIFALRAGDKVPGSTLAILATLYPAEALQVARAYLAPDLIVDLAAAAPEVAIAEGLSDVLVQSQLEDVLRRTPTLLPAVRHGATRLLPAFLVELLNIAPEIVLSVAAAVECIPRTALAKTARESLVYDKDATAYPIMLWSTYNFEDVGAHRAYSLFTSNVGRQAAGFRRPLGWCETNLYISGMVQHPFRLRAFRYRIDGGTMEQVANFAENCCLSWTIGVCNTLQVGVLSAAVRRTDDLRNGTFYVTRVGYFDFFGMTPTQSFELTATLSPDAAQPPPTLRLRVTLLGTEE